MLCWAELGCQVRCAQVQKGNTAIDAWMRRAETLSLMLLPNTGSSKKVEESKTPSFAKSPLRLNPTVFSLCLCASSPIQRFYLLSGIIGPWPGVLKGGHCAFQVPFERSLRELKSPAVVRLLIYYQIKENLHFLFFSCPSFLSPTRSNLTMTKSSVQVTRSE